MRLSDEWDRPARNVRQLLAGVLFGLFVFLVDQMLLGHTSENLGDPSVLGVLGLMIAAVSFVLALAVWLIDGVRAEARRLGEWRR